MGTAVGRVLDCLSDAQLFALAAALHDAPSSSGPLVRVIPGASPEAVDAVIALRAVWLGQPAFTGPGLALALRVGAKARRDAQARRARPVWTGPLASGEQRLTSAVLHELLVSARERILLVSFAAYALRDVGEDLAAAVRRGCQVDVVFETTADSAGRYSGQDLPFGSIDGITRWRWPPDQRSAGGLLHAKLLVVDGARAMVGSANLSRNALDANIEVGVLLEDGRVVAELEEHVRLLMRVGALVNTT